MESTNLTTRIYTAQTCTLQVTTKNTGLPHLSQLKKSQPVDFILHLDRSEHSNAERMTLSGIPAQLSDLQQSVSQYVAQLVAKFPLPTTDLNIANLPEVPTEDRLPSPPEQNMPTSGLKQHLPGLNPTKPEPTAEPTTDFQSTALSSKNISKLLGLGNPDRTSETPRRVDRVRESAKLKQQNISPKQPPNRGIQRQPGSPYLTEGDRSLDHKLHLGSLATPASGEVLTLSAIQLFDLSAVLDEYVAEVGTVQTTGMAIVQQPELPSIEPIETPASPEITTTNLTDPTTPDVQEPPVTNPLSRLPNLRQLPAESNSKIQVYDYGSDDTNPGFLSVIPWAAGAAIAVGVPLLLFGSKSNSLKDLTSNVTQQTSKTVGAAEKLSNNVTKQTAQTVDTAKKSLGAFFPAQEPVSSPDPAPNAPTPWEEQPVTPPPTRSTLTNPQMAGGSEKIGIAPLPPTVMNSNTPSVPAQVSTAKVAKPATIAGIPSTNDRLTGVAPNPLNSPSIASTTIAPSPVLSPGLPTPIPNQIARPQVNNPVTTLPASPAKIATAPTVTKPKVAIANPITKITPAKVAPVKQSIAMPPDVAASINSGSFGKQATWTPPEIAVANSINPAPKPAVPQKAAKPAAKVTKVVTQPKAALKPVAQPTPFMTPRPVQQQFTQPAEVTTNPNIITPIPQTRSEGAEIQTTPVTPPEMTPPNISRNPVSADSFDSPSLKEAKRFFQGKWQADPSQSNALQYVLRVSGKSGLVKTVSPQGEPASEYLKKSAMIKPGDKLISPGAGNDDRKIRVLLQPDGNVDAFVEP